MAITSVLVFVLIPLFLLNFPAKQKFINTINSGDTFNSGNTTNSTNSTGSNDSVTADVLVNI